MKIKALVSFSGAISMHKGEVKEYSDKAILQDLLQAKYIEEVKEQDPVKAPRPEQLKKDTKPKKDVKSNGNK